MTHGSLFSGIGGFDLAAEWAGWTNAFHCEWNEFGQKVLKYYWPNAESFTDITKTNFSKYENKIDVLTGGFPCQPYSMAGKRKGKADERHLWPEMLRAIGEIKPRWIVGENVYGLVNWSNGLVFHEVQADLEAQGYEVQPFLLPAAAVNAPHRRDRIWFIAHANLYGYGKHQTGEKGQQFGTRRQTFSNTDGNGSERIFTNPESIDYTRKFGNLGSEKRKNAKDGKGNPITEFTHFSTKRNATDATGSRWGQTWGKRKSRQFNEKSKTDNWRNFPTVAPICNGNDGLPEKLDGITFPKWRNESIKAGGNAIVPQVALQIFKAINEFENLTRGQG